MVLQNDRLPVPERLRDPPPLLPIEHHAAEVVVNSVASPEPQRVLCHHVERASKHGEGLPVDRMSVARGMDVRPGLVDFRVDGKRGRVDRLLAFDDLPVFVHEDQVRNADLREMLREGIQPEMIREDRIADGDVARDTLVEAAVCEDAERGGEVLLPVQPLFFEGLEVRVSADAKFFARDGYSEGADGGVGGGRGIVDVEGRGHGF